MKNKLTLIVILSVLFFSLTGCRNLSNPDPESGNGTKVYYYLTINLPESKSAVPLLPSGIVYKISAVKESGSEELTSDDITVLPSNEYRLALTPGTWNISVTGYSNDNEILRGVKSGVVIEANGKYHEPITITYMNSNGDTGSIDLEICVDKMIKKISFTIDGIDYEILSSEVPSNSLVRKFFLNSSAENLNSPNTNKLNEVSTGSHNVLFKFYGINSSNSGYVYLCAVNEIINVRKNLTTNNWVKMNFANYEGTEYYLPNDSYIDDNNLFYLTEKNINDLISHTFYVKGVDGTLSGTADDENSGTWVNPLATVQKAIDKIACMTQPALTAPSYTIFIDGHVYNSSTISLIVPYANVLICGFNEFDASNPVDILDGYESSEDDAARCGIMEIGDETEETNPYAMEHTITLKNLLIQNGYKSGEPGAGIYTYCNTVFDNVIFRNNEVKNSFGAALFISTTKEIVINDCIFDFNKIKNTGYVSQGANVVDCYSGSAISNEETENIDLTIKGTKIINNSVVYDNSTYISSARNLPLYGASVFICGGEYDLTIENTTIKNNNLTVTETPVTDGLDYYGAGLIVSRSEVNGNPECNLALKGNVYLYDNINSITNEQQNLLLVYIKEYDSVNASENQMSTITSLELDTPASGQDPVKIGFSLYQKKEINGVKRLVSPLNNSVMKIPLITDENAPTDYELSCFVSEQGCNVGKLNDGNGYKGYIAHSKGSIEVNGFDKPKFSINKKIFYKNKDNTYTITVSMPSATNPSEYVSVNNSVTDWNYKLLCKGDPVPFDSSASYNYYSPEKDENGNLTNNIILFAAPNPSSTKLLPAEDYVIFVTCKYNGVTYSESFNITENSLEKIDTKPVSGTYSISSKDSLMKIMQWGNNDNLLYYTFEMESDIETDSSFTGLGTSTSIPFKGTIDGKGHTISGLTVPLVKYGAGTIKNLTLEGNINGAAAFVDNTSSGNYVSGNMSITNCINYANITNSSMEYIGVFYAYAASGITVTIDNCINYGNVTGTRSNSQVGGIIGFCASSTVRNCSNYGYIKGKIAGGIAGGYANIKNCANYGNVETSGGNAGGIIGSSRGDSAKTCIISNCCNYGSIIATGYNSSAGQITGTSYIINGYLNYGYHDWCYFPDGNDEAIGTISSNTSAYTTEQMLAASTSYKFVIENNKSKLLSEVTYGTKTPSDDVVTLLNYFAASSIYTKWKYDAQGRAVLDYSN